MSGQWEIQYPRKLVILSGHRPFIMSFYCRTFSGKAMVISLCIYVLLVLF